MDKEKNIRVLYFGALSELFGKSEEELALPANTGELVDMLKKKYPGLSDLRFSISVNREICRNVKNLGAGDEVALLPPFSGG